MGYTKESRNYSKLVATAFPATGLDRGLASDLYYELLNNGFNLIYQNGGGPVTDSAQLWKATEVVLEPKNKTDNPLGYVDELGKSQPWRLGLVVQGDNGNELVAYLGTPATLTSTGVNRSFAYPVILLEGGDRAADTRISPTKEHGFRVTITDRGVVILVWNPMKIEDMRHMGLLCIQRPVKCDGTVLVDGFSPVFAVHNTDPLSGGRSRQSERFFRTTIRERDTNIPPKSQAAVINNKRKATGTISLRNLTDQQGTIRHEFRINGVKVWFGQGQQAPQSQDNTLAYFPSQTGTQGDPLLNAAEAFARQLKESTQGPLQELTYFSSGPNVILTAKNPGAQGNSIEFAYVGGSAANAVLSPSNGYLGGGGGVAVFNSGYITLVANPAGGGATENITLGYNAGEKIAFIVGAPTTPQERSVQVGATMADTLTNLFNRLLTLKGYYANLADVQFTMEPTKSRIKVEYVGTGIVANWKMATGDAALVTVSAALSGGSTNIASGNVDFFGIPSENSILQMNGVDFKFMYGAVSGAGEISLGTRTAPASLDQVVNSLLVKLVQHPSDKIQSGRYSLAATGALPSGTRQRLVVQSAGPGVEGNTYTLFTDTSNIGFTNVGANTIASLTGGAGFAAAADTAAYPDEISEITGKQGATMYRFPNKWEGPVQTDTGEYVLVFPFGFTTEKVSFTEEMDMIAVSKGAAYQGVQNVNINVYSQPRTYTSYCSNFTTQSDYVRVFVLTNGGGI